MNYAIEWLKQERELMTIEAKYALNDDELNRINKIIEDFTEALNKLTIPVFVGRSEQFKCRNVACDNMVKVNSGGVFCKKHRRKLGI